MNVRDFGATGDGQTDDRAAFQQALLSGGEVYVPNGHYLLGSGSDQFSLRLLDGARLRGESRDQTVLLQAPGSAGSVRLLQIEGSNVCVDSLTLDGQENEQADNDEHRAGIIAMAKFATIRNVLARNFTGDGFYFYRNADSFEVTGCTADGNGRNGLTVGYGVNGGRVAGSKFLGNTAQQFDSEPGGGSIADLLISGCEFDGQGASDQHVLTVSGSSPGSMSSGWRIEDCRINGGVHVTWCRDIEIVDCRGINTTKQPSVSVYRTNIGVMVADCDFRVGYRAPAVVTATGTAEGGPSGVVLRRCRLRGERYGVLAEGAVGVELYDSDVNAQTTGFYARATSPTRPFARAIAQRNRISASVGIQLAGNGAAIMSRAVITDNAFDVTAGGMSLDDGTGCVKSLDEARNEMVGLSTVMRL